MDQLFVLQLIASFILGGAATALQILAAERVSGRTAGIVLALPTTIAIAFFFMGWALSAAEVARVIPAVPLSLGISTLFPAFYLYTARISLPKPVSMTLSITVATLLWLLLVLPLAVYKFSDLYVSLAGYVILSSVAFMALTKGAGRCDPVQVHYTMQQTVGRALFAGLLISVVVYLSKTLSPFWGGVMSTFPAAWTSGLLILHHSHHPQFVFRAFRMAPIGVSSLIVYSLVVMITFPSSGIVMGTLYAYVAAGLYVWALLKAIQLQS